MKIKYLLLLLSIWSSFSFAETTENIQASNNPISIETAELEQHPSAENARENSIDEPVQEKTSPIPLTRPFGESAGVQTQKTGVVGVEDFFTTFLALMLILMLIAFMTWVLKRSGLVLGKGGQVIKILASVPVGSKEKVALIEVGKQQVLIGITANQINKIMTLTETLDVEENISTKAPPAFFNTLLKQKNV